MTDIFSRTDSIFLNLSSKFYLSKMLFVSNLQLTQVIHFCLIWEFIFFLLRVSQSPNSTILKIFLKKCSFLFSQHSFFHSGLREFILVFGECFLSSKKGVHAQKFFHIVSNNQNLYILNICNEDRQLEKFHSRYRHTPHGLILR